MHHPLKGKATVGGVEEGCPNSDGLLVYLMSNLEVLTCPCCWSNDFFDTIINEQMNNIISMMCKYNVDTPELAKNEDYLQIDYLNNNSVYFYHYLFTTVWTRGVSVWHSTNRASPILL